jgi:hypothetical protein
MGFLAPGILAGLLAIGLPIYLHLLKQHKTTPRPFSSLMFFERRVQSSIQHRRLKYHLLFALRALFVALLIFAFARPYLPFSSVSAAHGGRVIALLLDDSFSMREGGRFKRAQQEALNVVRGMGGSDRAQVISFGGPTRLLTNLTNDKSALTSAISGLEQGDGASSYAEAARAIRSLTQSSKSSVEAHLFSDMQKTSAPASFADLKLPEGTQLVVHAVASSAIPNFAVENVIAPRRIFSAKTGTVQATIVSYSDKDSTHRATLMINHRGVETKPVTIPAGGRATVEFTGIDVPYGLNSCEVDIDSADAFPQDDHFYFAVERSDPAPALFLHEQSDDRSFTYFQTALAAVNQPAFSLQNASYGQAASSQLDRYAFIVLNEPATLPRGLEDALRRYVQHGGSLLVILGAASSGRVPVADLAVTEGNSSPRDGGFNSVARVDATNPALRSSTRWDSVRFYRTETVQAGAARVLMSLDDGRPLLLERQVGDGRVMVLASSLNNIENDLPVHPVFIPFVQQTAGYLGHVDSATGNYVAGAFYDLHPGLHQGDAQSDAPVEVTGPNHTRLLSLSESTRARGLPLENEGFYDIRRQNGRHELAAVNPDRRESDFTVLPADTLALWVNTGRNIQNAGGGVDNESDSGERKNQLWWWVLFAALVVAIAESVLGNRHLDLKEGTT